MLVVCLVFFFSKQQSGKRNKNAILRLRERSVCVCVCVWDGVTGGRVADYLPTR